jgi:hypothetical protein
VLDIINTGRVDGESRDGDEYTVVAAQVLQVPGFIIESDQTLLKNIEYVLNRRELENHQPKQILDAFDHEHACDAFQQLFG